MFNKRSPVLNAVFFLSVIGIISRGFGFIREIIFASFFGVSPDFDLYLVSVIIPFTINTIGIYIAQNYIVPNYNSIKTVSQEDSRQFIKNTLSVFTLLGLVVAGILFISSGIIFKNIFSLSDNLGSAVDIYNICLLSIPLSSAFAVVMAYYQSELNFKLPAIAQLSMNFPIILFVLLFSESLSTYSIAIGYVAGCGLQLVVVLIPFNRIAKIFPLVMLPGRLKHILSPALFFIVAIEAISQLYLLSDRLLYRFVDTGGIASLNYAYNLFSLPFSIFSMAITTVALPNFSNWFMDQDKNVIKGKTTQIMSANLVVFIPVSFLFFFEGDVIIRILFQRGMFDINATSLTFSVLKLLTVSLVFLSLYSILNKIFYSLKLIKQLLTITICGIVLKVTLNLLLVNEYKQEGLAIGTAASYFFFFAACYSYLHKKKILAITKEILLFGLIYTINAVFSWWIAGILFDDIPLNLPIAVIKIFLFILIYILSLLLVFDKIIPLKLKIGKTNPDEFTAA